MGAGAATTGARCLDGACRLLCRGVLLRCRRLGRGDLSRRSGGLDNSGLLDGHLARPAATAAWRLLWRRLPLGLGTFDRLGRRCLGCTVACLRGLGAPTARGLGSLLAIRSGCGGVCGIGRGLGTPTAHRLGRLRGGLVLLRDRRRDLGLDLGDGFV